MISRMWMNPKALNRMQTLMACENQARLPCVTLLNTSTISMRMKESRTSMIRTLTSEFWNITSVMIQSLSAQNSRLNCTTCLVILRPSTFCSVKYSTGCKLISIRSTRPLRISTTSSLPVTFSQRLIRLGVERVQSRVLQFLWSRSASLPIHPLLPRSWRRFAPISLAKWHKRGKS